MKLWRENNKDKIAAYDCAHKEEKAIRNKAWAAANPEKVKALVQAEELLGTKLFDALGVGGVYSPCRASTMDIVLAGETPDAMTPISKQGRSYHHNPDLKPQLIKNQGN